MLRSFHFFFFFRKKVTCLWNNNWLSSVLTRVYKCQNHVRGGELRLKPAGEDATFAFLSYLILISLDMALLNMAVSSMRQKNLKLAKYNYIYSKHTTAGKWNILIENYVS